MNIDEAKAWLRAKGVTEAELIAQDAELDQEQAEVDDVIVWALRAKKADSAEETIHAGRHIVEIVVSHGPLPMPTLSLFTALVARCAGAILTIGAMQEQIEALQARVERLRAGRE